MLPRILRKIGVSLLALTAVFRLAAAHSKPVNDATFSQIDAIVKSLSEITGLSEDHPVPYGRIDKRKLRQFLTKRIKKTLKPEEIRADELSLKMFGLVPQDFNLRQSTIDLLTEQAAAFYDYDEKKLFLLDESSFEAETTTLAHELAHALADQHFNLDKFMDQSPADDDENLAHTAVVEGQASWLMIAVELKQAGRPPVPTPEMLQDVIDSSDSSMADYPVLKGAPLYIQQSLLFPYTAGTMFFDAVYQKIGKRAFAIVFTDPPVDSSQILHPDRYFAHEKPTKPELPKLNLGAQKELTEGSVGEFDHQMLIRQYLGESQADLLGPHVRGGNFQILSVGKHHEPVLEYLSQWDTTEHAAAFFTAYQKILRAKWKHCDMSTNSPETVAGSGDNGYFVTRLKGDTVLSIEGLADMAEWNRLKAPTVAQSSMTMPFRLKIGATR